MRVDGKALRHRYLWQPLQHGEVVPEEDAALHPCRPPNLRSAPGGRRCGEVRIRRESFPCQSGFPLADSAPPPLSLVADSVLPPLSFVADSAPPPPFLVAGLRFIAAPFLPKSARGREDGGAMAKWNGTVLARNGVRSNEPVIARMRTEFLTLRLGQTVAEALAGVRADPPRERILYFYVVDERGVLLGVIPTRSLLLAEGGEKVESLMQTHVVSIPSDATLFDACELFVVHRFLAFPVVDGERRIIGVLDVETFTDEIFNLAEKETVDGVFQLIGIRLAEARRQGTTLRSLARRFPWLLCSVAGGIAGAEGAVWLLIEGERSQVDKALKIVEECRDLEEGAVF